MIGFNFKKKLLINNFTKNLNIDFSKLRHLSNNKIFMYNGVNSNLLGHLVYQSNNLKENWDKSQYNRSLLIIKELVQTKQQSLNQFIEENNTKKPIHMVLLDLIVDYNKRFVKTKEHNEIFFSAIEIARSIADFLDIDKSHIQKDNNIFLEYLKTNSLDYQGYYLESCFINMLILNNINIESSDKLIDSCLNAYNNKLNKEYSDEDFLDIFLFDFYKPITASHNLEIDYYFSMLYKSTAEFGNQNQKEKLVEIFFQHFQKNISIIEKRNVDLINNNRLNRKFENLNNISDLVFHNQLEGFVYLIKNTLEKDMDIINNFFDKNQIDYIYNCFNKIADKYFDSDDFYSSYSNEPTKIVLSKIEKKYLENKTNSKNKIKKGVVL